MESIKEKACLAYLHLGEEIILNWNFYTIYKFVDNVQVIHYMSQNDFYKHFKFFVEFIKTETHAPIAVYRVYTKEWCGFKS